MKICIYLVVLIMKNRRGPNKLNEYYLRIENPDNKLMQTNAVELDLWFNVD